MTAQTPGRRILVVDDDHAARRGIARGLQRMGYSVLEAESADQAMHIVHGIDRPVDLVVTDIVMPEVGGFRLMEMIVALQPDVRTVYVSGYSQDEVDWSGVPASVWAFVTKPMSLADLGRAVGEVLARPTLSRADAAASRHPPVVAPATLHPTLPATGRPVEGAKIAVLCNTRPAAAHLVELLGRSGFTRARDVADDRELAQGAPWDLVVLDVGPDCQPPQALLARADRGASAPCLLLLSSAADPGTHAGLLEVGVVDLLRQPVDPLLLVSTARNLLRIRSLERQLEDARTAHGATGIVRTAERNEAGAEILRRLARAAEFRDELTSDHAERVGRIAAAIAGELGWTVERRGVLEEAGILHDVGKIAIPDALLRKPTRLTPAESLVMQEHTTAGAQILGGSRNPVLVMAEEIARSHHERWDGKGYPAGLAGTEIPDSARIVSVADSFDAMTHMRPYRSPIGEEQALVELVSESGRQYDAEVVQAFLRVHGRGELRSVMDGTVAFPDVRPTLPAILPV